MKFYIKNASGEEETISVDEAIVRTGYNYKTKNDTIDIYDESNPLPVLKRSIDLSEGVSITITKN